MTIIGLNNNRHHIFMFLILPFLFPFHSTNAQNLNYGDYYPIDSHYNRIKTRSQYAINEVSSPVYPYRAQRVRAVYTQHGRPIQPMNRPPHGTVYWPPAMLNARGQTTGLMMDNASGTNQQPGSIQPQYGNQIPVDLINGLTWTLLNAITSALFPHYQQPNGYNNFPQSPNVQTSNLPFISLIPSAGINLGPSQQYGYGSNLGVYAGIQNQQNGYAYNYNTQNGGSQGHGTNNVYGQQIYGRPYGPDNSNVGGSYGGLSQWPFVQPLPRQGPTTSTTSSSQTTNNQQIRTSTMARPQPTQTSSTTTSAESQTTEQRTIGTVRSLSLQELMEAKRK